MKKWILSILVIFAAILLVIVFLMYGLGVLLSSNHHVYSTSIVYNQDNSLNIKVVAFAISWNDVGYKIKLNDKDILEYENTVIYIKWVNKDSVLIVTNSIPIWNKKKITGCKVEIDTFTNNCNYLYDNNLYRVGDTNHDTIIFNR